MSIIKIFLIMTVIVLSGCQGVVPRPQADLNHFIIDCSQKDAQLKYLQSLRRTLYEEQMQTVLNFGDKDDYTWMLNHQLLQLSHTCN